MSTPYNGTEGYSGTDTSRERAETKSQSAKRRQTQLLRLLASAKSRGATVVDVKIAAGDIFSELPSEFAHHGTASGTLSILHRAGQIARLTQTRDGAHVYVLPEHIDERPFERFVGNRERAQIAILDEALAEIEALRASSPPVDRLGIDLASALLRDKIGALIG